MFPQLTKNDIMIEEGGHRQWPSMTQPTTRKVRITTSISHQKNSHTYHLLNCCRLAWNPAVCSRSSWGSFRLPTRVLPSEWWRVTLSIPRQYTWRTNHRLINSRK